MLSIQMSQLWTIGAVLAGFQVAALTWRIKREIDMERQGETTWLTLADYFVMVSFLILIFGVFAGPAIGALTSGWAVKLFGFALIVFGVSPLVLAGHYNLYCPWGKKRPRSWVTRQEAVASFAAVVLIIVPAVWWALA